MILFLLLVVIIIYEIKKAFYFSKINTMKSVKASPGDILLFFSNDCGSFLDYLLYNCFTTLFTNIPLMHYGVVLNNGYYLESRRPPIMKWDNHTKRLKSGPRIGKLKYLNKDWSYGPIVVIKTNVDKIPQIEVGENYWYNGGCIGVINYFFKKINKNHSLCLTPEDFIKKYSIGIGRWTYSI